MLKSPLLLGNPTPSTLASLVRFVQELLWVKTNQLQRIIRTGRTGHWLNHSKEHCLIGVKVSFLLVHPEVDQSPSELFHCLLACYLSPRRDATLQGKLDPRIFNVNLDCDVICAEVRETSRKPDEMYDLLER